MTSELSQLLRQAANASPEQTSLTDIFSEDPVSLEVFVKDKKFLSNPPLGPVQFEAVRYAERIYLPETYPLMSQGGFDPYWSDPLRMVNFVTLQWGKGSSSPNVPIYNARTGRWVKLKDWNSQDKVASAYPEDGKVFSATGTAAFREGHGRMFKVRTRKGHEIEVWEGHRFLTWARRRFSTGVRVASWAEGRGAAWERLWDLQVGDPIAISTTLPEPSECLTGVPDRDVELVGMWLGDGGMKNGNSVVCGLDAPITRQRARELFEMFPYTWVKEVLDESGGSRRWKIFPKAEGQERYLSGPVNSTALNYGLAKKIAHDKAIPESFYSLDNRQVALLLSRLIDTDGWVSFSNTAEIGYGTVSKQLALDVQRIMLRLGAVAELKEKTGTCQNCVDGERHPSYQLRVRDRRSLANLAERLTLLDKEPKRLELLNWLVSRAGRKQRAVHGDLMWDKIESIEYVGDGDYWTLSVDGSASYVSSNGILDHNSGKDHVCRIITLRVAYLLLCLRSPQDYYGMPSQDTIHLLNVAATAPQALRAFFKPITRVMADSKWFKDRCDPTINAIMFDKNIEAISGNSDAETQEGLNLMLGVADEVDAFKSRETARSSGRREALNTVEGILEMIQTSGATRFPSVYKNVRISYPRFKGSPIQRLTKKAAADVAENGDKSRHYVSGPLATWEVNPRVPGKEAFAQDYKDDPVMARSKYECLPARAITPYFRNTEAVESCFVDADMPPLDVLEYELEGSSWVPKYVFSPDFRPIQGAKYAMHGDLAVTSDKAGISMAHVVRNEEFVSVTSGPDGEDITFSETRPFVKVDFVCSYEASASEAPPREIQIRWARLLCFTLVKRGFNIVRFTFDGFECLSGDTKIPLLDGTTKTMRELEGAEPFWVYSIKDGRVVPGLCTKAWKTSYRSDMVEVALDNGESIRATSDHRFMLRDGSYRKAGELCAGDSLMPLYRRMKKVSPTSGLYEQIWHPEADGSGQRWRFTHSMVSQYSYGVVPKGSVTHHRNCNALDNAPENLIQVTNAEHSRIHNELNAGRFEKLWADPEWRASHILRISEARRASVGKLVGVGASRYSADFTFELIGAKYEECVSEGIAPTRAEVQKRVGCSQDVLYDRVRKAGFASWKAFRESRETPSYGALATRRFRSRQNHKVVSVTQVDPEWVYDLQVEEHHNFATSAGVFVHNSRDSMQILKSKGIESTRVSTDLSELPWKTLRDLMYEGRLTAPYQETVLRELLALDRLPGGKIDHPPTGSKDLADALACAVFGAVEVGGEENEEGEEAFYDSAEFNVLSVPGMELPIGFSGKVLRG